MRKPKCHEIQYIDFLIASPVAISFCEASRSDPRCGLPAAHDSYNRLLHRLEPDPKTLYQEVEPLIHKQLGILVIDDSTLDKPYSQQIKPVTHHWSGKHHAVVKGINLLSIGLDRWRSDDACGLYALYSETALCHFLQT